MRAELFNIGTVGNITYQTLQFIRSVCISFRDGIEKLICILSGGHCVVVLIFKKLLALREMLHHRKDEVVLTLGRDFIFLGIGQLFNSLAGSHIPYEISDIFCALLEAA